MRVLILILLIMLPTISRAEKYSFEESSTGVDAKDVKVIMELMKMSFSNDFGKDNQVVEEGAGIKLKANILKLDSVFIIGLQKEKAGKMLYSATIKVAKDNEMDNQIKKLLRSVMKEQNTLAAEEVGEVSKSEGEEAAVKRKSFNRWRVAFGPGLGTNLSANGTMFSFTLGYSWEVRPQWAIRTFWDSNSALHHNDARFNNLGLGLQYWLNASSDAPFVLADLGYAGATKNHGGSVEGFALGTGLGYTFFRNSAVTFDMQLRYALLTESNASGVPQMIAFMIGINFDHF